MIFFLNLNLPLRIVKVSKYRTGRHGSIAVREQVVVSREFCLQHVGGALTLWALLAGAVQRLEVQPLAVFAPGARRGLGALPGPPHGTVSTTG